MPEQHCAGPLSPSLFPTREVPRGALSFSPSTWTPPGPRSPEASSPPVQASALDPRGPPGRIAAQPGSTRAAEPFAGGVPTRVKVQVGALNQWRFPWNRGLGPHKSRAKLFSWAPLLQSGKTQAGLGHHVLLFFAEGLAAPGAGIWEASSLVGTPICRAHARP